MKKNLALSITLTLVATSAWAYMMPKAHSKRANRAQTEQISNAWRARVASIQPKISKDMTMVYGGKDMAPRPTLDAKVKA